MSKSIFLSFFEGPTTIVISPFKGKRNNPTYIKYTGAKVAELLSLTPAELSNITITNTNKVMNRESNE